MAKWGHERGKKIRQASESVSPFLTYKPQLEIACNNQKEQ